MRKYIFILSTMVSFALGSASYAQNVQMPYAVTNFSVNYLRLDPDYESPLETQELMGVPVKILETSGYWKKVSTPQPYEAWCTDMGLAGYSELGIKLYIEAQKYICTALYSKVYEEPKRDAGVICDLVAGDLMRAALRKTGTLRTKNGFVQIILPDNTIGWVRKNDVMTFSKWTATRVPDFPHIYETALQFVGIPYLWGGMSVKGMDCSGFIRYTFFLNGLILPRNASQQCHCGLQIKIDPTEPMAERISELRPGDLVFFGRPATAEKKEAITHVAMYIGNGRIIHSSHLVRINSLFQEDPDYYANSHRLIRACRIISPDPDTDPGTAFIRNNPAYFPQD